jgi:hypothetical protein
MTVLRVAKEKKRGRPLCSKKTFEQKQEPNEENDDHDELTRCLLNLPHMTIDLDLIARKVDDSQREQLAFENSLDDSKKVDEIYFIVSLIMKENIELKQENISNRMMLENYRSHYNHITSNCYIIQKDKCPHLGSALEFERMMTLSPDEFNT